MGIFRKKRAVWIHDREKPCELIWRIPNEKYPKLRNIGSIVVREIERAVVFSHGEYQGVLSQGEHSLPKGVSEVIWVDVSPKVQPYGIPRFRGPITMDHFQFGFNGKITLNVNKDIEKHIANFVMKVVSDHQSFTCRQLVEWLQEGLLTSVFRDIVKDFTFEEFMRTDRERIVNDVRSKLVKELSSYGLRLISIDIAGVTEPQKVSWKEK